MADSLHTAPRADLSPSPPVGLRIIETNGRGRGLAATRPIARGEVLERATLLVLDRAVMMARATLLDDYVFWWDDERRALALGWISLCNHSCPANAVFRLERAARMVVLEAATDIAEGCEITINYHGDPSDPAPVWFPVV